MSWKSVKQRVTDSAIESALNAFWIALWGVAVSGIAVVVLLLRGTSLYVLVALGAIASTLVIVLAGTASVVFLQRRARRVPRPARQGQKGFLDYKIQGLRALNRITAGLTAMTRQTEKIGREFTADAKRMDRTQRGRGNTDERGYKAMRRAAAHLERRASIMQLHATNYASDVRLFIEGTGRWIDWVLTNEMRDQDQLSHFATVVRKFQQSMDSSLVPLETFRSSVEQSRLASEEMDIAGGSLSEALGVVINATKKASEFCGVRVSQLLK